MKELCATQLRWSSRTFLELAWPLLRGMCGGGRLLAVESDASRDLMRDLDMQGVDWFQIADAFGVRGLASRMQSCPMRYAPFDTFNKRLCLANGSRDTEFKKHRLALKHAETKGSIYPFLTAHGYTDSLADSCILRSVAVAKTRDVIEMMSADADAWPGKLGVEWRGRHCVVRRNSTDGNMLIAISWDTMAKLGARVEVIRTAAHARAA